MPPKKKPFYRPRNILIALALLFAFAVAREVYIAMTAVPGASENYPAKVAALIESSQPKDVPVDSPNAIDLLDQAIAIEAQVRADVTARAPAPAQNNPVIDYSILRGPMSTRPYGKAGFEQIKANSLQAIDDLGKTEFYDLLDQMAAARRAVRPTPATGNLVGFMLPNLGRYRNLARLNGARMYISHHAGPAGEAELVRTYEQTLALGRAAGHGSFLIEYLVAIAIDALAMVELREGLIEVVPSEATLVQLLAVMDRQQLPGVRTIIEGERLSVMDTIQSTHTDDGRGSGRLITSKMNQLGAMWGGWGAGGPSSGWMGSVSTWKIMNVGGAVFPSKASNVRRADDFFNLVQDSFARPYSQRADAAKKIDQTVDDIPQRYVLLRMILPAWGKSLQSSDQHATAWEGTRAMLAIEIYRHRNGRYPEKVEDIVPSVLPAAPIDPMSGRPFGYRLLEAGADPDGRKYLLYSAGADQKDDGGTMAKSNVDAFRLQAGRGFDFIINEPRTKPEPDPEETVPAPTDTPDPSPPAPAESGTAGSPS